MGKVERLQAAALRDVEWIDASPAAYIGGVLDVEAPIVFQPRFELATRADDPAVASSEAHCYVGWLPRGRYRFEAPIPPVLVERGRLMLRVSHYAGMSRVDGPMIEVARPAQRVATTGNTGSTWHVQAIAPAVSLDQLSWRKG